MAVADPAAAGAAARRILDEVERVVLGQEDVLRHMLIVILAGGHGLIEGVPGTAKTLAVRSLGLALDASVGRGPFTPDLMPTDLTGRNKLDEQKRELGF
jgi:MoxR-like ATPase